ncbi:MAG: T9SS type A sorting domain-containing protein [Candidatus Kapabacteria bacterium]|nr:T9SS type A sorting domain-containing protein [Candidatus Kapabacteria bacterium]
MYYFLAILFGSNFQNLFAGNLIEPPTNLRAELVVEKTSPVTNIAHLLWNPNSAGEKATGYNVYIGYPANGQVQYKLYSGIKSNGTEKEFSFDIRGLGAGLYYFKVMSTFVDNSNKLIESIPAETKLEIKSDNPPPPTDYIKFNIPLSQINLKAGEKYTIKLETVTNRTDCKVIYNVVSKNSPDEFKFDLNGNVLVIWSDTDGKKFLNVNANLECDPKVAVSASISIYGVIGNSNGGGGTTDYVKFVNPKESLYLNTAPDQQFTFQFKAETNMNCPVKYILEEGQSTVKNFKFDATSGYFSFMPTKDMQWVSVVVTAYSTCNEKIRVTTAIKIQVTNATPNASGVVYGKVVDENGASVKEGTVQLWSITKVANGLEPVYKAMLKDGSYMFDKVPAPAEYRVKVDALGYGSVWYDGVNDIGLAKTIKVDANTKTEVNFGLKKLAEPKKFTLTGKVSNEKGEAVMAYVVFVPAEQIFKGSNNNSKDPNNNISLMTKTNADGSYSIQVPENLALVAYVKEMLTNSNNKAMYLPQYYNGVESPMEADIIFVTEDVADINFVLKALPTKQSNGFAGTVKNETGVGLVSNVIAIKSVPASSANNQKTMSYSTTSDDKGNFSFKGLEAGDYVVLSIPMDKQYIPGYIKSGDFVSLKWKDATKISVNDMMSQVIYEAKHKAVVKKLGVGGILGNVKGTKGIANTKNNSVQTTTTLTGALVYVTDETGKIVDYAFTEKTGNFEINELSDGVYNLVSDAFGYVPVQQTVVVDYKQNPIASTNIDMTEDASVAASVDLVTDDTEISIFPMPVNTNFTVNFEAQLNSSKIEVLTATGSVVYSTNINTIVGQNKFTLNTDKLANGVYFIIIDNGLSAKAKSFVISR